MNIGINRYFSLKSNLNGFHNCRSCKFGTLEKELHMSVFVSFVIRRF